MDTCIVMGNGPSLRDAPRDFLGKFPTFGVNKIFLLDDFRPTYYVTVHPELAPWAEEIRALGAQMFITDKIAHLFPGATPLHSIYVRKFQNSHTELWNVWEGWSVVFVCLQIAYWLGYQTALLVGVDFDYSDGHFHPDYMDGLPDSHKNSPHDQSKLLPAFRMARQAYEADGRRIINLTPGTKEPVFEKGNIAEWL